jgi:DNA-binding cell septation regulator SpoVG
MPGYHRSRPPTSAELAASWGVRPTPPVTINKWRSFRNEAGTIRAFFSATLPSGLIVHKLKLMVGPAGKRWVALPSEREVDGDGRVKQNINGKVVWSPLLEFTDRSTRDKFQSAILGAVRLAHPEEFEDEP